MSLKREASMVLVKKKRFIAMITLMILAGPP
jgi:hypothetical protein